MSDSRISKFFEKDHDERLEIIQNFSKLSNDEIKILNENTGGITFDNADKMVENVIGTFALPLGIATNFKINDKDYLIPMVIEEPSVVAAASSGAKISRIKGGIIADADPAYSIGQIQVVGLDSKEMDKAIQEITESNSEILQLANSKSTTLSSMNKGAKSIQCRVLSTDSDPMLIVEIMIDVADAMGANVTNTMCEAIAPMIEKLTGGRVLLRILSNYSTNRMAHATAVFDKNAVGEDVVNDMILAAKFAKYDPYRAVTHNKGIMNGLIAVANAVGQDNRAIEAAANAYASKNGKYTSLTEWSKDKDGNLVGKLIIPLSVGIVGGVTKVHPIARICMKILGVESVQELACVMVAVGLVQNFSAMRALVTDGIQKGHMRLHARNIACSVGAKSEEIDDIVEQMVKENNISIRRAKEIYAKLDSNKN